MTQAIGSKARWTYVQETAWGTTPTTPTMKALAAATYGESMGAQIEELRSNAINSARSVQAVRGGNIDASGSVPFELSIVGMGTMLKNTLGTNVTSGSGTYTHTMKRGALPAGLTLEKGFTDIGQYMAFTGSRINRMSMSLGPQGLATGSFDFMAKGVSASTTTLGEPAAVTHAPIVHHEAAFLEGGVAAQVLNFSIDITNNISEVRAIGSRYRAGLPEGIGEATGQITFMFEDVTKYNKWFNETQTALQLTYTVTGGSLAILLPAVKFFGSAVPALQSEQGVVIPMTFRAIYDSTEATDVKITLTNSEAAI